MAYGPEILCHISSFYHSAQILRWAYRGLFTSHLHRKETEKPMCRICIILNHQQELADNINGIGMQHC